MVHLRKAFELLRQNCLFVEMSKCQFGQTEVEYLGHIINTKGVTAEPSKISMMVSWPVPRTIKEVRGFLGLTRYYRRFIKGYGLIAKPLVEILKKDKLLWTDMANKIFNELKTTMTTTHVFALPNFSLEFIIEIDVSENGIGAVLM